VGVVFGLGSLPAETMRQDRVLRDIPALVLNSIPLDMLSRSPTASLGELSGEGSAPLVSGDDQGLGFRSTSFEPETSVGFKLPARIFFPLAAQIDPVRIFSENEF
jgi:hypothetical protein